MMTEDMKAKTEMKMGEYYVEMDFAGALVIGMKMHEILW